MKLTFFGSSHGVPEPHRRCASILIEVGQSRYFIDMGTQSIEKLIDRRIPPESVKGIFITHMHGDHTDGLIAYLDLCNWYYKTADPKIYLPADPEEIRDCIDRWLTLNSHPLRPFDFRQVKEGTLYDDGVIRLTAFQTMHTADSYAYLLEAEGKRVLFSGDLKVRTAEDFPVSVLDKPLDLAICECAHFEATVYLPYFENRDNVKKLCFNHYSDRFFPSILQVEKALTNIEAFHATDDMEIFL